MAFDKNKSSLALLVSSTDLAEIMSPDMYLPPW